MIEMNYGRVTWEDGGQEASHVGGQGRLPPRGGDIRAPALRDELELSMRKMGRAFLADGGRCARAEQETAGPG